jgi:predicted SprT family Zn-dependent metalloprotease
VVDIEWSTKLRTTAGLTRLKQSRMNMRPGLPLDRTASIELSTKVLDTVDRLRSTLLHEMVHAAAWIVDGVSKPPHGTCFKRWARKAMKSIPGVVVTTTHNYEIEFKYAWVSLVAKKKSERITHYLE